jgi:ABC-type multidrug transport system fused ATPase/permease subunit
VRPVNSELFVSTNLSDLLKRLWGHLSLRRRVQLATLLLLMSIVSLAEVVSIGAVLPFLGMLTSPEWVFSHQFAQPLIHVMGLTEPSQLLLPLTVIFAVTALVSGGLRVVLHWAQARLSHAIGADFSGGIYERTLYQPYSVHIARNSSEVIAGITSKANGIVNTTVLPCLGILSSVMMLLTILAALFALQPYVALLAICGFGGIYAVAMVVSRRNLKRDSEMISREQSRVIKALQEALGGIRDVLIDGTQAFYCKIYENSDRRLRRAQSNVVIISGGPRFVVEAWGMSIIAGLAYFLASRPEGLQATIPVLGALALGAQRMLPVLQYGYSNWSMLQSGRSTLVDVLDLLRQPLPDSLNLERNEALSFTRDISFQRVGFRYGEDLPWVVKDFSYSISKGSRIGFIGTTGSGKSTLLDILMGLLSPSSGTLAIDGLPVSPATTRSWQKHIAHVPQSIFLADTTVKENIAFGVPAELIDDQRVRVAAKRAQIADSIESWPQGYETMIGERGVRLSGGQRQRIGIARALYKDADVVVFDEATSALDSETERAVMDSIANLDKELTIIMVAHRLTTLSACSQIVELVGGKIKRIGTYQEIVGRTGNAN